MAHARRYDGAVSFPGFRLLQFKVTKARYSPEWKRLHFAASGVRNGVHFTVVSDVHCLRDPVTPERIHLAALLKLTQLFNRPSASGG